MVKGTILLDFLNHHQISKLQTPKETIMKFFKEPLSSDPHHPVQEVVTNYQNADQDIKGEKKA